MSEKTPSNDEIIAALKRALPTQSSDEMYFAPSSFSPFGQNEQSPFNEDLHWLSNRTHHFAMDKDPNINPKFPPLGVIKPRYLDSSVNTGEGDYAEPLPPEFRFK